MLNKQYNEVHIGTGNMTVGMSAESAAYPQPRVKPWVSERRPKLYYSFFLEP